MTSIQPPAAGDDLPAPLAPSDAELVLGPATRLNEGDAATVSVTGRFVSLVASDTGVSLRFASPTAGPASTHISFHSQHRARVTAVSPIGLERRREADGPDLIERSFVFHDQPCAVLEWQTGGEPRAGSAVRLVATPRFDATAATAVQCRVGPGTIRIDAGPTSLCISSHEDSRFEVRDGAEGIVCTITLPLKSRPVRLAVTAVTSGARDIAARLDAVANAGSMALARVATLRRRARQSLALRSEHAAADHAIRNAVQRIDAVPVPAQDPEAMARLALAAVAVGETRWARTLLSRLPHGQTDDLAAAVNDWTGEHAGLDATADPDRDARRGEPPDAASAANRVVASDPMRVDSVTGPILGLVHDVLGVVPDAARGRIRIRPVFPPDWGDFEVPGLPLGDARLRLALKRSGHAVQIEVEQTHGAVPVRVVLEPVVKARALLSASVDGVPASLVPRPLGDRIVIPVQLVLDHSRHIALGLA